MGLKLLALNFIRDSAIDTWLVWGRNHGDEELMSLFDGIEIVSTIFHSQLRHRHMVGRGTQPWGGGIIGMIRSDLRGCFVGIVIEEKK